jgi:hypothetical protein
VSQLAPELSEAARRAGKTVKVMLPVIRPASQSVDPPRRTINPLPHLDQASRQSGFGKQSFLCALAL